MKGASRHMHRASEMHLIEGLRRLNLRRRSLSTGQEDVEAGMIRATRGLDFFSAHIRLRELGKSEDKGDPEGLIYLKAKRWSDRRWTRRSAIVPQRRIYRSRRKGRRCKTTDSRAMDLVASWYRKGGTSMESSILYSHGG
ncbi:hypothetical protein BHE74_00014654 [Ensete ventricosum]|nr:hypothetical protein BHE74_00014654 [Ensete ventricosum]